MKFFFDIDISEYALDFSGYHKALERSCERWWAEIGSQIPGCSSLVADISIVSAEEMREINKEQRGKDSTTDVLSFPLVEDFFWPTEKVNISASDITPDGKVFLGDILIAYEVAAEQAGEFKLSVEEEIAHLLTHGLLHLMGLDHERSDKEEALMEGHEEIILEQVKSIRSKRGEEL